MSGGLTGPGTFSTAFTPASVFTPDLPYLRSTIQDADPATLDQIAATWTSVHEALRGAREELKAHVQAATDHWTGAAADAFAARGDELHQSLGNGADYATNASTGVTHAAAALRSAKQDMPQVPGPLEGISPLSRPAVAIPLAPATGSTTGLTFNGAHEALVQQRQQEAETVLQKLGFQYESAATMIGTPINLPYHDDKGVYPPPTPVHTAPEYSAEGPVASPRNAAVASATSRTSRTGVTGVSAPAGPGKVAPIDDPPPGGVPPGTVIDGSGPANGAGQGPGAPVGGSGEGGGDTGSSGPVPPSLPGEPGNSPGDQGGTGSTPGEGGKGVPPVEEPAPSGSDAGRGSLPEAGGASTATRRPGGVDPSVRAPGASGGSASETPSGARAGSGKVGTDGPSGDVEATAGVPSAAGARAAADAERPGGGTGGMPPGMGSGMGRGAGRGSRRRRRREGLAQEDGAVVGEEFAGRDGIGERLQPAELPLETELTRAGAELRGGVAGGEGAPMPVAGIVAARSRGRRRPRGRSRTAYLLEAEEFGIDEGTNPAVID